MVFQAFFACSKIAGGSRQRYPPSDRGGEVSLTWLLDRLPGSTWRWACLFIPGMCSPGLFWYLLSVVVPVLCRGTVALLQSVSGLLAGMDHRSHLPVLPLLCTVLSAGFTSVFMFLAAAQPCSYFDIFMLGFVAFSCSVGGSSYYLFSTQHKCLLPPSSQPRASWASPDSFSQ